MHVATHIQAATKYPAIYDKGNTTTGKQSSQSIGFEAWSFAVTQSGIVGNLETVNRMKLYDFFEVLNYMIKTQAQ